MSQTFRDSLPNPPNGQADPQLLNPWGIVANPTSPWWVANNNAGVSTLYNGQGVKQGLVVNIPSPVSGVPGTPTGVVFTGASWFSFQADGKTTGAVFTFVTEDGTIGTIAAWGPGIDPQDLPIVRCVLLLRRRARALRRRRRRQRQQQALLPRAAAAAAAARCARARGRRRARAIVVDNSSNPTAATGAVYKGATIAQMTTGGPSYLYVTNIRSGRIEVYDTNFNPVQLPDIDGRPALVDREIPEGFAPFNVQQINGGYMAGTEHN